MEKKEIEIFSEASNHGIVRLPNREYPGVVIQGDSLFSLLSDTLDVLEELKSDPKSEAFHAAYSLAERLEDRLKHYIDVCESHGIEWSFSKKRSVLDYEELINNDL